MPTLQKVLVIFALTGMATALVLPGRQTAQVITSGGNALSNLATRVQGR